MPDNTKDGVPRRLPEAPEQSEAEYVAAMFASALAERKARDCSEPGDDRETDRDPETGAPMWLVQALEESDADIAAGRLVSSEVVHEELRRSIARMEARRAVKRASSGS